jgi:hypothetical protein
MFKQQYFIILLISEKMDCFSLQCLYGSKKWIIFDNILLIYMHAEIKIKIKISVCFSLLLMEF